MIRYKVLPSRQQLALHTTPIHRHLSDDGSVWSELYRSHGQYLMRFPELADFEVSIDGTQVIAHPAKAADAATVEHIYINQLIPLALSRQGRPAFHASVVAVSGGAIAFLGPSGAGKSTLAASFALHGSAFLADDALFVEQIDGSCRALPSHPSLRLWEDSVEALVGAGYPRAGAAASSAKSRLLASETLVHRKQGQALLAAFVLQAHGLQTHGLQTHGVDAIKIRALRGMDCFMSWIAHSFLLDSDDQDLLSQHFEWTHRISSTVPTFSLDYPRDYGILPALRTSVQQHLAHRSEYDC